METMDEHHQDMDQIGAAFSRGSDHADEHGDGRHLGRRGDIGRNLVHGPLVDVRGPDVERKDGQFKEEPAEGEQQADDDRPAG